MTLSLRRMERWLCGAVVGAVALGSSAAPPGGECLDPPPPIPVPPPEAFEACQEGTEGSACEVVLPGLTVEGVCVTASGGALFCRPFLPPPPPPEAIDARTWCVEVVVLSGNASGKRGRVSARCASQVPERSAPMSLFDVFRPPPPPPPKPPPPPPKAPAPPPAKPPNPTVAGATIHPTSTF